MRTASNLASAIAGSVLSIGAAAALGGGCSSNSGAATGGAGSTGTGGSSQGGDGGADQGGSRSDGGANQGGAGWTLPACPGAIDVTCPALGDQLGVGLHASWSYDGSGSFDDDGNLHALVQDADLPCVGPVHTSEVTVDVDGVIAAKRLLQPVTATGLVFRSDGGFYGWLSNGSGYLLRAFDKDGSLSNKNWTHPFPTTGSIVVGEDRVAVLFGLHNVTVLAQQDGHEIWHRRGCGIEDDDAGDFDSGWLRPDGSLVVRAYQEGCGLLDQDAGGDIVALFAPDGTVRGSSPLDPELDAAHDWPSPERVVSIATDYVGARTDFFDPDLAFLGEFHTAGDRIELTDGAGRARWRVPRPFAKVNVQTVGSGFIVLRERDSAHYAVYDLANGQKVLDAVLPLGGRYYERRISVADHGITATDGVHSLRLPFCAP